MAQPRNQVQITCEHCHKTFSVKASMIHSYRFCSMKCRTEAKTMIAACHNCGKEFVTYKKAPAKYCSISCGVSARNRTEQNPSYCRDISGDKNPMFGKKLLGPANGMYGRKGEKSPNWKGGRKNRPDGYIRVVAPPEHPHPCEECSGTKYVLEHRLVIEQHIGRYLDPTEVVHHIDGNPRNNAIENLRLFANQSEHIREGHGSPS